MANQPAADGSIQGLHRDAVGLVPVLFQSVANDIERPSLRERR